jgi:hypothetical protein
LTLPTLVRTIGIFGAGEAAAMWTGTSWVNSCRLCYRGALDRHRFETLSHVRQQFPHVVSILMDENTLAIPLAFVVNARTTRSTQESGLIPAKN